MNNFKIIMEEYGISEEIAKLYESDSFGPAADKMPAGYC